MQKNLVCARFLICWGHWLNPANVTRHLIGVYELEWLGPIAEVLKTVGTAMLHGSKPTVMMAWMKSQLLQQRMWWNCAAA